MFVARIAGSPDTQTPPPYPTVTNPPEERGYRQCTEPKRQPCGIPFHHTSLSLFRFALGTLSLLYGNIFVGLGRRFLRPAYRAFHTPVCFGFAILIRITHAGVIPCLDGIVTASIMGRLPALNPIRALKRPPNPKPRKNSILRSGTSQSTRPSSGDTYH
jgi:hypothetical protein